MKSSRIHIVGVFLMLCNLVFTQVVVEFFHEHHKSSEVSECNHEQQILHEALDECKVCDLNISHELFGEDIFSVVIFFNFYNPVSVFKILSLKNSFTISIGRSPPFSTTLLS